MCFTMCLKHLTKTAVVYSFPTYDTATHRLLCQSVKIMCDVLPSPRAGILQNWKIKPEAYQQTKFCINQLIASTHVTIYEIQVVTHNCMMQKRWLPLCVLKLCTTTARESAYSATVRETSWGPCCSGKSHCCTMQSARQNNSWIITTEKT